MCEHPGQGHSHRSACARQDRTRHYPSRDTLSHDHNRPDTCCAHTQVKAQPDTPVAVSAVVEPASSDDWEVVEQNADYMEKQLLNQARPCRPSSMT